MTESEQAPTWRARPLTHGQQVIVPPAAGDDLIGSTFTALSRSFKVVDARDGEVATTTLNALQTSLSEANAEVTRLRGALEEIEEETVRSTLPLTAAIHDIARAALAREENP